MSKRSLDLTARVTRGNYRIESFRPSCVTLGLICVRSNLYSLPLYLEVDDSYSELDLSPDLFFMVVEPLCFSEPEDTYKVVSKTRCHPYCNYLISFNHGLFLDILICIRVGTPLTL